MRRDGAFMRHHTAVVIGSLALRQAEGKHRRHPEGINDLLTVAF
jgi:hypothetical protein